MTDDLLVNGILIAAWILSLVVLCLVVVWLKRRKSRYRDAVLQLHRDDAGVMAVPVVATFTGLRGLHGLIAVASNSLNPRLVVRSGSIDYRVTAARSVDFEDIGSVRILEAVGSTVMDFTFSSGPFTFSANVGTRAVAEAVLAAYPALAAKQI